MKKANFLLLAGAGVLLMSADQKGCEQAPQVRELKKIVQVDEIEAAPLLLINESFDYKYVANQKFHAILFDEGHFYNRLKMPGQDVISVGTGDAGFFGVQKISVRDFDQKTMDELTKLDPQMKTEDLVMSSEARCMLSNPQYHISGSINSLEASGGGGVSIGFNSAVGSILPVKAKFEIDRARMDLSMFLFNGSTDEMIAAVNDEAIKNDFSASIGIDLGLFNIGPSIYSKTGLAEVTEKGLKKVLDRIVGTSQKDEWYTRVLFNRDTTVTFVGGKELNIQVGDKFNVVNEEHLWEGAPCGQNSSYHGSVPTERNWEVEVTAVGDGFSRAKVLNAREDDNVEPGARVTVKQLYVEPVKK